MFFKVCSEPVCSQLDGMAWEVSHSCYSSTALSDGQMCVCLFLQVAEIIWQAVEILDIKLDELDKSCKQAEALEFSERGRTT